jgi:hypothetical protein
METSSEGFIVSTDDGWTFYCSVAEVGGARERRWIFISANRQLHVGPKWTGVLLEPQLRQLVNDWWLDEKQAAHAVGSRSETRSEPSRFAARHGKSFRYVAR